MNWVKFTSSEKLGSTEERNEMLQGGRVWGHFENGAHRGTGKGDFFMLPVALRARKKKKRWLHKEDDVKGRRILPKKS